MKLSIGFSPCPNDTFIFDALIHGRVDPEGLDFELVLSDVEELNQKAFRGDLDITKLSYHALAWLGEKYQLLDAGSALGRNCGPLLIAPKPIPGEEIPSLRIAIPGKYTTANFLLDFAFPQIRQKREMLFSEIENAVLDGQVDAGLIIHENRFTYADKGLVKLIDLGEYWEEATGNPIPLGGIAIRRSLPESLKFKVNQLIRKSVEFAFSHPEASRPFVRKYAQEMDPNVMQRHIQLYVNEYSIDLGTDGRSAVEHLFKAVEKRNAIPGNGRPIFLEAPSA
jgi:1,4-dihydroxy-6-naphthoate synthase